VPLNWRPVGPEPASTYWTRRAVLALAVLVVGWGLLALLTGGGQDTLDSAADGGEAPASPSPAPAPSERADPSAGAEASETPPGNPSGGAQVPSCSDADLELSAAADKEVYALGETPTLVLTVRNTSDAPCQRDLGQGASELLVTSGRDRIWSSDDCSPGGAPGTTVLDPGEEDVQRLTWSATRSRPGCEGDKAAVAPGTYVVSGRNGELRAEGDSFRFEG
jgi:hypothetical protein